MISVKIQSKFINILSMNIFPLVIVGKQDVEKLFSGAVFLSILFPIFIVLN
jgi:hypothetical protein